MSQEKEGQTKPALDWVKSDRGFCEIYANMIHVTWSFDDVRIRLGQVVTNPKTPNPGPEYRGMSEERGAITLSWRIAKILRDQLTSCIDNFEKQNSEVKLDVKLPPSLP